MNYEQLKDKFLDKAKELSSSSDTSARYRANAYSRVASKLETLDPKEKASGETLKTLELSEYMQAKANEYIQGKTNKKKVKLVKTSSKSKDRSKSPAKDRSRSRSRSKSPVIDTSKLSNELLNFMGIGPEKAAELIAAGLKHINQLHMKKYKELLPEETKLFIDMKPIQKIPNEHIKVLEPLLMQAIDDKLSITITGSYRREKPYSSDIDLMVVSDEDNAIQLLLNRLTKILDGKVYPYSKGADKMSLLVDMTDMLGESQSDVIQSVVNRKAPTKLKAKPAAVKLSNAAKEKKVYKIDAFRTNTADKIPMLLYSTGSKEFNVMMRGKAKKLGYLLNQKGLFKDGKLVPDLKTELDYFKILDLEYKEPKMRL
jgi:DNA polymerase/3'-5' exonuclease PolX